MPHTSLLYDNNFLNILKKFKKKLDIELANFDNLATALTHISFWGDFSGIDLGYYHYNYERLEFLGDSVIALSVCSYLFENFPDADQGLLSKLKSRIVSAEILGKIAKELSFGNYIRIGKGMILTGGREHITILGDCFEAVVGAIFLEKNFDYSKSFIIKHLKKELEEIISSGDLNDYKSLLQEIVQKQFKTLPLYQVVKESGPDHNKIFTIKVIVNRKKFGSGKGTSKKEAENMAAKSAIAKIQK